MQKMIWVTTFLCSIFLYSGFVKSSEAKKADPKHEEHQDKEGHGHEDHDHDKKPEVDAQTHSAEEEGEGHNDHGHDESEKDTHAEAGSGHTDSHKEDGGHSDHDDHGEAEGHEEGNSKVGPDKGILEANEKSGFKLSPEAYKNFGIQTIKIESVGPWTLPLKARMLSQEEVNLYRIRDGFIKRIDFNLLSKSVGNMNIASKDLKDGDEVIISGVGFVRIAELAAYGGAPEGHSH